jgi:hypothetical protein
VRGAAPLRGEELEGNPVEIRAEEGPRLVPCGALENGEERLLGQIFRTRNVAT